MGRKPGVVQPAARLITIIRRKSGARFISIDPSYTATAELMDADWYPINPGTDHALALGIMHALLEMDSPENPLIDWEFLRRCTVGFDESNMPAGADPKKNFKDYLLGTYTGKPTTRNGRQTSAVFPHRTSARWRVRSAAHSVWRC